MVEWLLVLHFLAGTGISATQIGPFKSEAACLAAGRVIQQKLSGRPQFVCVSTDRPKA
jgi:hypothetical protein